MIPLKVNYGERRPFFFFTLFSDYMEQHGTTIDWLKEVDAFFGQLLSKVYAI